MNFIFKKILLPGFFLLIVSFTQAQVSFSASISPTQINKDEYATLRLVVENSGDVQKIAPPSLNGFFVVSGPNQETGMSSINGEIKQFIALTYVLQPRKPGRIQVGAALAVIGGKEYKTRPVSLLVKNAVTGNNAPNTAYTNPFAGFDPFAEDRSSATFDDYILKKGEDIADKVSRNMQMKLQTDKTTCFVGEPIVASYKLYTRLKSESKLSKNPAFNGFSVIDLQQPDITGYARESLNGKEYNVYTIRKAQLYPLQAGPIELEPAVLDNRIEFIKAENASNTNAINELFDDISGNTSSTITQSVSLSSKPLTITVKPLPEKGKPAIFNGAVGDFDIRWNLEKNSFSSDEGGVLTVVISGSGNLQLVTAPDINWPEGIEAFEPKLSDELTTTTVPVSGTKVFRYAFSVGKEGAYTIPALSFAFFNPGTASYKTVSAPALSFNVSKGSGIGSFAGLNAVSHNKSSPFDRLLNDRLLLITILAILMVTGIIFWLRRRKSLVNEAPAGVDTPIIDENLDSVVAASAFNQLNPLEETGKCLYREDCVEFYSLLNKELNEYLANHFALDPREINTKTIASVMDRLGIENETILELQRLLEEVKWQLYTPFEQGQNRQELYSRSLELIQLINSYTAQAVTR